jgi:hypothetical protein
MKTKFLPLSLLLLSAVATISLLRAEDAPAGPTPPPAGEHGPRRDGKKRAERRLQMLDEKLQLTPAQKDQIKAIWAKAEEQGKALRADATLDRDDRREKMGDIMKDSRAQVRGTLTSDQQKTFDALPPEGRGGRGLRPAGGAKPADLPPAKP